MAQRQFKGMDWHMHAFGTGMDLGCGAVYGMRRRRVGRRVIHSICQTFGIYGTMWKASREICRQSCCGVNWIA